METRRQKWGRTPKPDSEKRRNVVNVWLTDDELAELEQRRGKMRRGAYVRACYQKHVPPEIPEINRQAWTELSRAASNLNQIARKLNNKTKAEDLEKALDAFRDALIGAKP